MATLIVLLFSLQRSSIRFSRRTTSHWSSKIKNCKLEIIGKGSNVLYGERVDFQYLSARISPQWNYKNIYFSTGIYAGYLYSVESNTPSASRFITIEKIKNLDFGICIGPGYRLFRFLNIGMLYDIGLANIYSNKTYGANGSVAKIRYSNRNWLFYTGATYKF